MNSHKGKTIRSWMGSQLKGTVIITATLGVIVAALAIYDLFVPANPKVINLDNDGRTGVLVVWLIFVLIFSAINTLFYIGKYFRRSKRS